MERVTTVMPVPAIGLQPLREAVFELFSDEDAESSMIDPLRIEVGLPEFVHHRELLMDFTFKLAVKDGNAQATPMQRPRIRQWDASKRRAVQFTPDMCGYNVVGSAYTRFEDEPQQIKRVVRFYLDEARPTKLASIGHRYINAVAIPLDERNIEKFFPLYPRLPEGIGNHPPVVLRVQTADLENGTVTATLKLEKKGEVATYLLDIYARSKGEIPTDADAIVAWHESIHRPVREAFRLCVADGRQRSEGKGAP